MDRTRIGMRWVGGRFFTMFFSIVLIFVLVQKKFFLIQLPLSSFPFPIFV